MNRPKKVIFHCYYTPDTVQSKFSVEDVRKWHLERGFNDVGYHWLINREGLIEKGREENQIGAHTKGQNTDSIGIAYEGTNFPSAEQWLSVIYLYRKIHSTHGLVWSDWFGHCEFANKDCPGFDPDVLRSILRTVQL